MLVARLEHPLRWGRVRGTQGGARPTDATITATDRLLGGNANGTLAPGASLTWDGPTVMIPFDINFEVQH